MASRERTEIDLPSLPGKIVPQSMFSCDDTIHIASDKASVLHELEKLVKVDEEIENMENDGELCKVIMFDGMARVIKKSQAIKACKDFVISFVNRLMQESKDYSICQ